MRNGVNGQSCKKKTRGRPYAGLNKESLSGKKDGMGVKHIPRWHN